MSTDKVTHLVGNIKSVKVTCQPDICLFLSIGPDEGVDFRRLDIVQPLDGLADLALVRLDVDDEDERVVLLDLLHRALRVQRGDDGPVLVHPGLLRDRRPRVLGLPR